MIFKIKKVSAFFLLLLLLSNFQSVFGQFTANQTTFEKVKLMIPNGEKILEENVRVRFLEEEVQIETVSGAKILKTFRYSDIKTAEYSYSKNPRWKTGLGLGAAGLFFPPLLLVAIPLGFTKHRRHWLTFQGEKDFAVLKLSKSNRKIIIPAFETKTGVKIAAIGENK